MAGYVFTSETLASVRSLARGVLGHTTTHADDEVNAHAVLGELRCAEGLAAADIREVAEWARKMAKDEDGVASQFLTAGDAPELRRHMAECSHIVELCDGILLALAADRMPDGSVQVLGRIETGDADVLRFGSNGVAGGKLQAVEAANEKPAAPADPDSELERTKRQADRLAAELSEARQALGAIAFLCSEAGATSEPWTGEAGDVVSMVERRDATRLQVRLEVIGETVEWINEIGERLGLEKPMSYQQVLDAAKAAGETPELPRYEVPDNHPLATHDWRAWLDGLLRCEEITVSRGTRVEQGDRRTALRQALGRVEMRDRDGLRGLDLRLAGTPNLGGIASDELDLFYVAATGIIRHNVAVDDSGAFVCGVHRVPRLEPKEPTP